MCGIPSAANVAWRNIPHCLNVHKEAAHSQCGKRGGWFGRGEKKKPEFSPPSKNKINRRQVEALGTDRAARFNVEFREVLRRTRIHTALGLQFSRIAHICKEVDMLKYSLRENLLTPAPDDYMAQAADVRSYTLDEIIDLMMDKGTTLTRADVAATLQVYGEVCSSLIKDGSAVNTPLFNTALTIAGVFNGANDAFDKKRHTVNLNLTAGTLLRDAAAKVKCEKTEGASTDPYITEIADIVSGKVNEGLTKGGVVQLTGSRLKFDQKDAAQGIFFVPETGEAVRAEVIAENKPARLMAIIPAGLKAGTYYIEVRTKLSGGGKPLKVVKVGRFAKPLTVTP